MTHALLVRKAVEWLRSYRCGVILSEQACISGEMPDAIGWKKACHSVLVECKVSWADFLVDRSKPFRQRPELGVGNERFYLAPRGLISSEELPSGWGLLEYHNRQIVMLVRSKKSLRADEGFRGEMNLLLASLRPADRIGVARDRAEHPIRSDDGNRPRAAGTAMAALDLEPRPPGVAPRVVDQHRVAGGRSQSRRTSKGTDRQRCDRIQQGPAESDRGGSSQHRLAAFRRLIQ